MAVPVIPPLNLLRSLMDDDDRIHRANDEREIVVINDSEMMLN